MPRLQTIRRAKKPVNHLKSMSGEKARAELQKNFEAFEKRHGRVWRKRAWTNSVPNTYGDKIKNV